MLQQWHTSYIVDTSMIVRLKAFKSLQPRCSCPAPPGGPPGRGGLSRLPYLAMRDLLSVTPSASHTTSGHKRHKHLFLHIPSKLHHTSRSHWPHPWLVMESWSRHEILKSHHFKCPKNPRTNVFQEASWQGSCPLALA